MKTPFPWFGGKSRAANLIWSRLGSEIGNYVEPFLGSAAVWLNRPNQFDGWAALNDKDGNIANFWRAMQHDPDGVCEAANYPVSEADLHARHLWLVNNVGNPAQKLECSQENPFTGAAWLSSARGVRCWVKSRNERNPYS